MCMRVCVTTVGNLDIERVRGGGVSLKCRTSLTFELSAPWAGVGELVSVVYVVLVAAGQDQAHAALLLRGVDSYQLTINTRY